MDHAALEKESFETALGKLENVVKKLEDGDIQLAELLEQYTQGIWLAKFCMDQVAHTEKAMDKLLREDQGKVEEFALKIEGESNDV